MGLLDGKKALVCGVTNKKSIAWGIAQALHAHGARIAFTCVEGNVRRVKKLAPDVHSDIIIPCDVSKDEDIARAMEEVGVAFAGSLDILVHSIAYADINDLEGEFIRISRAGWNLALGISAYSLVALARHARPLLQAAGGGSIMALTFAGGHHVVPGYNIMGVAKAALDMSIRYLAYDLGPDNIRVNALSSGPIPTLSSNAVKDFEISLRLVEERAPLLRNVSTEDVGNAAIFLASDLSDNITGETINVDSGMNIMLPPTRRHPRATGAAVPANV